MSKGSEVDLDRDESRRGLIQKFKELSSVGFPTGERGAVDLPLVKGQYAKTIEILYMRRM